MYFNPFQFRSIFQATLHFAHSLGRITFMDTAEKTSETQALLDHLLGKPLDPETYRRIRERQERLTAELCQQHGEMNIAVDLVREVRDET